MKISLTNTSNKRQITEYSDTFVSVNNIKYYKDIIITPDNIIDTWNNEPRYSLTSIQYLLSLKPEILILGTGGTFSAIPPSNLKPLIETSCPFEIMDTPAACRTFNILAAEERSIVAALSIDCAVGNA